MPDGICGPPRVPEAAGRELLQIAGYRGGAGQDDDPAVAAGADGQAAVGLGEAAGGASGGCCVCMVFVHAATVGGHADIALTRH